MNGILVELGLVISLRFLHFEKYRYMKMKFSFEWMHDLDVTLFARYQPVATVPADAPVWPASARWWGRTDAAEAGAARVASRASRQTRAEEAGRAESCRPKMTEEREPRPSGLPKLWKRVVL